jgi:hypothetical protein
VNKVTYLHPVVLAPVRVKGNDRPAIAAWLHFITLPYAFAVIHEPIIRLCGLFVKENPVKTANM